MPAFNEEGNLERSVQRLNDAVRDRTCEYEVIVVNDGSRDRTARVLAQLGERYPTLRVVTHAANRGYGAALCSGFATARYEWVFMMDSDNQFDPVDLKLLLARASDGDIVAGRRKQRRDPLHRRLNAWAFFTLVTLLFGRLARDVNCGFKLMRRDQLAKMQLTSNGALINTEIFVKARRLGARVVEVPILHYPRTAGKQTGAKPRVVLRACAELLALRAEMKKET
jgi:glycosyltransferase involved in cell wall biosynthesis